MFWVKTGSRMLGCFAGFFYQSLEARVRVKALQIGVGGDPIGTGQSQIDGLA